jgi:hypothetical protein
VCVVSCRIQFLTSGHRNLTVIGLLCPRTRTCPRS